MEVSLGQDESQLLTNFGPAIILSSNIIKQYLINYARPLIYTTFMSYASLSAIKVGYDWLRTGKTNKVSRLLDIECHCADPGSLSNTWHFLSDTCTNSFET